MEVHHAGAVETVPVEGALIVGISLEVAAKGVGATRPELAALTIGQGAPVAIPHLHLVARAPDIQHPSVVTVAPDGRVFVAETYRYRSSVFDIRDYMWMLEDDLALRTIEDRTAMVKRSGWGSLVSSE